jgi:hypothetical protein
MDLVTRSTVPPDQSCCCVGGADSHLDAIVLVAAGFGPAENP